MNYKMMGKFLSQILIVEAGFMVPALLISLYTGSRAAVYGFWLSILITAGVGALMYYFCRNSTRRNGLLYPRRADRAARGQPPMGNITTEAAAAPGRPRRRC